MVSRMAPALRKRAVIHLLAATATITVFTILGPFGTWGRHDLAERALYWTAGIGVIWCFAVLVLPAAVLISRNRNWPEWVGLLAGSLLVGVPGTGIVALLETAFEETTLAPGVLAYFYGCVVVVLLAVAVPVYYLIERPRTRAARAQPDPVLETTPATPARAGAHPVPDLVRELPDQLGQELLHLRMQDHYVEVHTPHGHQLVFMRFRDALREVESLDGMQVHRSHWVARNAVVRFERRGGNTVLLLSNGARVPVSRSFIPALRDRGWTEE